MIAWLLAPQLQPFTIAAVVMLALLALQIATTFAGATLPDMPDLLPVDDVSDVPLGWLNLGKVPLLILLMLLLGLFAAGGMVLQAVAEPLIGLVPTLPAALAAGGFALLTTGAASRLIARILPREETYALSDEDLIGRVGTVTVGPLEAHAVGKISVLDAFGNRHFPRVRPATEGDVIEIGAQVLIVDIKNREYRVIRAPAELAGDDPTPSN